MKNILKPPGLTARLKDTINHKVLKHFANTTTRPIKNYTDDHTLGIKILSQADWAKHEKAPGLLINLINISDSYAVVCGPEIMLKFVTLKLMDLGYKPEQVYLSMNRRMSCGTGKCGRCNVGPYYLCKDGPDMNYALIKDYPNVFGM